MGLINNILLVERVFLAWILKSLWHLFPLIPLSCGYYAFALAGMLLVFLPYIKVKKLEQHRPYPDLVDERRKFDKNLLFWRGLTFTYGSRKTDQKGDNT